LRIALSRAIRTSHAYSGAQKYATPQLKSLPQINAVLRQTVSLLITAAC